MSKCNKCKYEYSSKIDEPCKYCREKCGVVTLGYQMSEDKFEPKEEKNDGEIDMVNHPQHYSAHGIEPIDYIESHDLNFNLGNVIKYISRAPYKGTELEDLKKAKCYLEREIKKHER